MPAKKKPDEPAPVVPEEPTKPEEAAVPASKPEDDIEAVVDRIFETGAKVITQAREEGIRPAKRLVVTYAQKLLDLVEGISDGITGDRKDRK
jgi:hypothetical protein